MTAAIEVPETEGKLQYKIMNAVMSRIVPTGLGAKMAPMHIMTVQGRKSGRTITTPVGVWEADGDTLMLAGGRWRYNFEQPHPVTLKAAGTTRTGTGTLDTDPDRLARVYREITTRVEAEDGLAAAARSVGLRFPAGRVPTEDEFRDALAGSRALVVLDLD